MLKDKKEYQFYNICGAANSKVLHQRFVLHLLLSKMPSGGRVTMTLQRPYRLYEYLKMLPNLDLALKTPLT